jgi:hypothetical protein
MKRKANNKEKIFEIRNLDQDFLNHLIWFKFGRTLSPKETIIFRKMLKCYKIIEIIEVVKLMNKEYNIANIPISIMFFVKQNKMYEENKEKFNELLKTFSKFK